MSSESPLLPTRTQIRQTWQSHFSHPSWLYPITGIYYFATHRPLHVLLRARLLPCALLSLFVLAILFIFAYLPQVAFLAIFHGIPGAFIQGAFLVLGEGAAIVALLFEAFFVDETLVDVFDAVLVNEGCEELVKQRRIVLPPPELEDPTQTQRPDPVKRLGKPTASAIYSPFNLRQILEFILFLPFNLIPVVGTPVFLLLTGYRGGPLHHYRYFKLLGLTNKERKAAVGRRQLRYTWFGSVALLLQLIPGLSMLFLLTTAAGSALWVVDLEKKIALSRYERVEESSAREDGGEEYVDDPV